MGEGEKTLLFLLKDGDINTEGTKNIPENATSYYKTLFGPAHGNIFNIADDMWSEDKRLSHEDNNDLRRTFTMEEVREAFFL
jgi:hypothetical protein